MLLVTLPLSLALLVCANLAARHRREWATNTVGIAAAVCLLFGCALTSPALLIQTLALALLSVALLAPWGRRLYLPLSLLATAGAWAAVVPTLLDAQAEYASLRDRYPLVPFTRSPAAPAAADPAAVAAAEAEIARREGGYGSRQWALWRLHAEHFALFSSNPGFGSLRMLPLRPSEHRLRDDRDRLTQPGSGGSPGVWDERVPAEKLHRQAAADFAHPAGFGVVRGDAVAGFQPHGFRLPPDAGGWAVERVDLLGLLLAPEPRVYVTDLLPRMDELKNAVTRPPDAFESAALARLLAGEELVHDPQAGRLVGALRAVRQCLDCHPGGRGDLVGAFSYRLRPR